MSRGPWIRVGDVLAALEQQFPGGARMSDLAQALDTDYETIQRKLRSLEASGHVTITLPRRERVLGFTGSGLHSKRVTRTNKPWADSSAQQNNDETEAKP